MAKHGFSVMILAAGKATRFKSDHSKVLHGLAGRLLGSYVLEAAVAACPEQVYMVVGHEAEEVRKAFESPGVTFIEQKEQLGTGHALMVASSELKRCPSTMLVVLVGDAPLLKSETITALVDGHAKARAAATVLTTRVDNPHGYGRVVRTAGGRVRAIVEEKACTPAQRKTQEINSGIICFTLKDLLKHIGDLSPDNVQEEFLLTDLIEIFNRRKLKVVAHQVDDSREVLGINDRVDLALMTKTIRHRKSETLMREGVTIVDPDCTAIDDTVQVGRDTVIGPGVSLLGSTRIGSACELKGNAVLTDAILHNRVTVRPFCVISGCEVASDAMIGPFAHLRDGALIDEEARIGNFVEVKKTRVGRGSKALHLTYLGDSVLGEKVNIGAGTVTCNYDGEKKHPTTIEEGVFIGSGSMLVAPLRVGRHAYVAAGSTITEDVPSEALAIGRARQVVKEGWTRQKEALKPSLQITVRGLGEVTVIEVDGRLTLGDPISQINDEVKPMLGAGRKKIILNLAKVSYVDSAGMGALVGVLKAAREVGGQLVLSSLTLKVRVLLETADLDRVFEIYPDEASAMLSFDQPKGS